MESYFYSSPTLHLLALKSTRSFSQNLFGILFGLHGIQNRRTPTHLADLLGAALRAYLA